MDAHSKNIQKYLAWYDELEEENVVNGEEDTWIISDSGSEVDDRTNEMDQNDMLQTESNVTSGYEGNTMYAANPSYDADSTYQNSVYTADPTTYNPSSTSFDYPQQTVIPSYANMTAPMQTTSCNSINDSFSYVPNVPNYDVESNNYYNPSLPAQSYQNQNQDMILNQSQNYGNLNPTSVGGNGTDHYLQVSDHRVPPFDSMSDLSAEHPTFDTQSSVSHMNVLRNDSASMCVDIQPTNDYVQHSIPNINQNFSGEINNVTCYTEPSNETIIETTVNVSTSEKTWIANRETTGVASINYETHLKPQYQDLNASEVQHQEQQVCETEEQNGVEIDNETNEQKVQSNESSETTNCITNETKIQQNIQICIRNGCVNPAIHNPEWEQEFCSNDCVILHCKNVFKEWVQANQVTIGGQ